MASEDTGTARSVQFVESKAQPAGEHGTDLDLLLTIKAKGGEEESIAVRLSVIEARRISRLIESELDEFCKVSWPARWS